MNRESNPEKLYIAVRADLPPGLQTAQACHAAFQFAHEHPEVTRDWIVNSNFIVVVNVDDENQLLELATEASLAHRLAVTKVIEPDLGDEYTAVAIEPGQTASALCASFQLCLRNACLI
ncbi:peptidyl tRNA hydrolase [Mycobacterium phage ScoobyDoobyDoo]|nr:peptidyl tRNA hydrolase [Mycobacterium phage ScoobyDoobyDoo]